MFILKHVSIFHLHFSMCFPSPSPKTNVNWPCFPSPRYAPYLAIRCGFHRGGARAVVEQGQSSEGTSCSHQLDQVDQLLVGQFQDIPRGSPGLRYIYIYLIIYISFINITNLNFQKFIYITKLGNNIASHLTTLIICCFPRSFDAKILG